MARPYRRHAILALALLAAGVAGVVAFRASPKLPLPVGLALFAGAILSIRLLHLAWTDLMDLPVSDRARWRLRLQLAFITPIAGPLYWLWLRPSRRPAA